MNKTLVEVQDIIKSYRITKSNSLTVLKGINLKILEGEILAIVGPSGAGKSTLLHIIGSLDQPDSGKLYFNGNDIFAMGDKKIAEYRAGDVGFIFQFHHLLPEFTAMENVLIASMINRNKNEKRAVELLEEVGLGDRLNHKPSELSGGEAQRVAIARALINSPKIILADEPTGNLDSQNADSIIDLLFKLREKYGQTFIIVTHNEEFARKCDRIVKLADGNIVN